MFWDSYTLFHIILSILLHAAGVSMGLWIWYLFPKNVSYHGFFLSFMNGIKRLEAKVYEQKAFDKIYFFTP